MDKDIQEIKDGKLEFNTFCIFTEENQDINSVIELIFKDYLNLLLQRR